MFLRFYGCLQLQTIH